VHVFAPAGGFAGDRVNHGAQTDDHGSVDRLDHDRPAGERLNNGNGASATSWRSGRAP
jgi:hypothetical protein